jgi:hypothetical protein
MIGTLLPPWSCGLGQSNPLGQRWAFPMVLPSTLRKTPKLRLPELQSEIESSESILMKAKASRESGSARIGA